MTGRVRPATQGVVGDFRSVEGGEVRRKSQVAHRIHQKTPGVSSGGMQGYWYQPNTLLGPLGIVSLAENLSPVVLGLHD